MSLSYGDVPAAIGTAVLFFVIIAFIAVIITLPLMLLINWLFAPALLLTIFGVSHLGFWQTWALMFITGVLFKGNSTNSN